MRAVIIHYQCPFFPKWGIGRNIVLTFQHPTLTFVFGPANDLSGILASFRISLVAVIALSAQLMNTSLRVWQVIVLHLFLPLVLELEISIIKLVLWGEVIVPTPKPQPGRPGFFCWGFPSLSHRFQLVKGARYLLSPTAAQLLKALPGTTRWGRATYDSAGRACVLQEGVSQHLHVRGKHWWHLLTPLGLPALYWGNIGWVLFLQIYDWA